MRTLFLCCLALLILGCRTTDTTQLQEVGARQADPQNVPRDKTLYNTAPVLALRFEASDAGYTMKAFRAMGVPTSQIDQSRDVIVKALDAQDRVLASVSLFNPRDVRAVGAKQPGQAVRSTATFTVFLPKPDEINKIEVNVLRGANSGFRQTFSVNPKELPPLEEEREKDNTNSNEGNKNDNKKP